MKILVLSVLIVSCLAGKACLPKGWTLEWEYPDDKNVQFSLTLNEETLDDYDWVGIGFKYQDDQDAMIGADINNFILEDDGPTDRYATINGLPSLDVEIGGEDNIIDPSYSEPTYVWTRPIDSQDEYDKVYAPESPMRVLWACGQVMGVVQCKHDDDDRDTMDITLDDGSYGCDDSFVQLN